MPQLTFHIKYNKGTSSIIDPNDIRQNYLFGINLQKQGQVLTDDVYQYYINAAVEQLQNYLGIKLFKQVIQESKDFYSDDWQQWGYVKTTYPVRCAFELTGYLGTIRQVTYPTDWLSVRKTSDGELYQRQIHIIPNSANIQNEAIMYTGILPSVNYHSNRRIPNYWTMVYVTGFDSIPADILNALGKIAALNILAMTSDALLYQPGMNTNTISLDGLSQSISLNANGVFSNRIKQYQLDLWGDGKNQGELQRLADRYKAITFGCA